MQRGQARNRLRNIYEQEKRRVEKLRERRSNNTRGEQRDTAPKRVLISERRTRREGFGRGGAQAAGASRRQRGGRQSNSDDRPRRFQRRLADKFADKSVFRSRNRERFQQRNDKNDSGRRVDRSRGGPRFLKNKRDQSGRRVTKGRGGGGGGRGGRGGGRGGRDVSAADLDAQLDRFHGNEGAKGQQQGRRNNNNNKGAKRGPVTTEDLDAQLSQYHAAVQGSGGIAL